MGAYRCSGSNNDELVTNLRKNSLIFDDEDYVEINELQFVSSNDDSSDDAMSDSEPPSEGVNAENDSEQEIEIESDNIHRGKKVDATVDSELELEMAGDNDRTTSKCPYNNIVELVDGNEKKVEEKVTGEVSFKERKRIRYLIK